MTHQAPLIPTRHGPDIWRRYRLPGSRAINHASWEDARVQGHHVGTCRHTAPSGSGKACGGCLRPGRPYTVGGRHMYPTTCGTCGHEAAAGGPTVKRSRR
ncbi:hypothetical protein GA0070616_4382 [Micromonospora nigra]|uniref:Uncharacterized protein n=1 Tax=Micromonospora nigra TaxID=145857 RepID=A0A1C6SR71_9ACTN|nr:hypothetical protein GA0070616_4382 [Micromonospora nigra]